jgi:hypothetical protein
MWVGAPVMAVGGGLYQLIHPKSPAGQWVVFQILSGLGYGVCSQIPILAVQVVLNKADIPTGLVAVMFFQMLGGALAPSIGQNLFTDALLRLLRRVEGIDAEAVVAAGAGDFGRIVPPELLDAVVEAFNSALQHVFWVGLAAPAFAWFLSWAMEWRQIPNTRSPATEAPAVQVPEE